MARLRFFFLAQGMVCACILVAWLAGCPATTATGVTPVTGVTVPIGTILDQSNLGCGTGPNDVYMYAATVAYAVPGETEGGVDEPPAFANCSMTLIAGGVFPCYGPGGTFGNLPLPADAGFELLESGVLPDGGSVTIWGWVAFYNKETWDKVGQKAIEAAVIPNGGGTALCDLRQTWTTTCVATERNDVNAPFHCGSSTDPSLTLGSNPPPVEGGMSDGGPSDAGSDGGPSDAAGPPDGAAPPDASDAPGDAPVEARSDAPPG